MRRKVRMWVRKAESDYQLACDIVNAEKPYHNQVCFLCQQSAEKYLKSLLENSSVTVPKSHDLPGLLTHLRPHYPSLRLAERGLTFLSNFAVPIRYPGANATARQAASAVRWAGRVRQEVRAILGLDP